MSDVPQVEILGRKHAILLPGLAEREEIILALGDEDASPAVKRRARAAALGLCTRLGRESGTTLAAHGYDVLAYGGAVYGWLREQGATMMDVAVQGNACIDAVAMGLAPREAEVESALGNSGAGEAS